MLSVVRYMSSQNLAGIGAEYGFCKLANNATMLESRNINEHYKLVSEM